MHDVRLALRHLFRRPAFAVIAILTLALGIGANAAVFTVSNAVLFSPLPYERPDEVVILNEQRPQFPAMSVTRDNYEDWCARATSFSAIAAFRTTSMTLTGVGDPEQVPVKMIAATLLPLLGTTIERGRNFTAAEDRPGGERVALLSAAFAARRFGGDDPVGRTVQLDNRAYTVVGVLPHRFELFQPADIFVPFGPWAASLPNDPGWHPGIFPIARLRAGVTLEQARLEMDGISKQLEVEKAEANRDVRALVTPAQELQVANVRPALILLTGTVVLVLLIACANVANLLLARAVDRQKELAVRVALGAGRRRIVRQLIVESLVLAVIGGSAGLIVAAWAVSLLSTTALKGLPRAQGIALNWEVIGFAMALSIVTGLIFGVVPALHASQLPLRESLNEEGRGSSQSARHTRLRSALVVMEVGLALVLLVSAGLLLRSFSALTTVSPGFATDHLLVIDLPLSPITYRDEAVRTAAVDRLVARLQQLPGVRRAAVTTMLPMAGTGPSVHFNRAAYPPKGPEDYVLAGYRAVTPGYLETLGVPLQRGRLIKDSDRDGAPPVVVINEAMAHQYFPDRDALGERIQFGTEPDPADPTIEIVGIVGDMKQSFAAGPQAEMFVPYAQAPVPVLAPMYLSTALVVRTEGEPLDITPAVRAALHEADPGQPLVNVRTMEAAMAGTVAQPRMQMTLVMVFASLAVALAAIGVYGVMAYTVSQRTVEIGVRMAIGASPNQVVSMVVWQGAQLAFFGVVLGLIAAALATGAMQTLLFEIKGLDPLTFVAASLLLGVAALLASYIPARRAARISPMVAMGR